MQIQRVMGLVLVVTGLVLMIFGYQSSQGMDDQVTQAVTGEYTDSTVWYWLAGAIACFAGSFLLLVRLR